MSSALRITPAQARSFLLQHQGLLGPHRFEGEQGILAFVRQAGSIQFDPINVCGQNPDLVLQSRVKGYRMPQLTRLLYEERALVDHFDKELCIYQAEDWPRFARRRQELAAYYGRHAEIAGASAWVKEEITRRGPLRAKDIQSDERVDWAWGNSRLPRAVLEALYHRGELGIHHKQGGVKHYELIERCLPEDLVNAPDPFPDLPGYQRFLVLRRAGAIGLIWDRASAAWLGIPDFKAPQRKAVLEQLVGEGRLLPVRIEGLKDRFFVRAEDETLLQSAQEMDADDQRCELIAPLDNLIWDRRLIAVLYGFEYTWEIYTPPAKRRYGYYVLPLLQGGRFVGRVEPLWDRRLQRIQLKGLWYEQSFVPDAAHQRALEDCLHRFEAFHRESVGLRG